MHSNLQFVPKPNIKMLNQSETISLAFIYLNKLKYFYRLVNKLLVADSLMGRK